MKANSRSSLAEGASSVGRLPRLHELSVSWIDPLTSNGLHVIAGSGDEGSDGTLSGIGLDSVRQLAILERSGGPDGSRTLHF